METAARNSLYWADGTLLAIDQRRLPHAIHHLRIDTVDDLVDAIRSLAIRGAPAIGIAGAFGVALATRAHTDENGVHNDRVRSDAERIASTRPTAVNLGWGVRRALAKVPHGFAAVLAEAAGMLEEDAAVNRSAAHNAAELVLGLCPDRPLRLLTHCNTGWLATGAFGTALGAIRVLAERGRVENVVVGETRPLLQGARLTAWELKQAGVPHRLAVDSAAAWAMACGDVDCVIVGADRIAANGDVANKIGTYSLAVAARRHRIPFVVVAPESTRDTAIASGDDIVVEQRSPDEVVGLMGRPVAPAGTEVFNPAFDITPADLVTAVVTERGTVSPRDGLADRIRSATTVYPGFPRPGVDFRDLAGLYADPDLFAAVVSALAQAYGHGVDRILAVDARGFVMGAALAARLRLPLTLARKPGKLPGETVSAAYDLEYGTDALHVAKGSVMAGEHVAIVDDVLATGGTLAAAAQLVHRMEGVVAGLAVVMELSGLGGRERLAGQPLLSLAEVSA